MTGPKFTLVGLLIFTPCEM